MEGESCVTPSIIDELHFWYVQGDQKKGESGVPPSIIDYLHSSDIQRGEMEGESDVTRSIIDELHSSDLVKWNVKVVLIEVSLMHFNLGISK